MSERERKARQHRAANEAMRAVRKQSKRNRKPDRTRQHDWLRAELADPDALDGLEGSERVMPRGERERRRTTLAALAEPAEAGDTLGEGAQPSPLLARGLVVEVASSLCRVELRGATLLCSLRGGLSACDSGYTNVVAVGDEVLVGEGSEGQGVVEAVLPRRSALARPDVFRTHLRQVVVANVDQLLIVASWREPALWFELVDRYLVAAARSGLAPVICLNKIDLAGDVAACQAALAPYEALGQRIVLASAVTGSGVAELCTLLVGRTTALAGLSGVGKSSLLAAVQPGLDLRTGGVSARRHEGRHTTTQVTLHRLAGGGHVVDTPGIREFGLAGLRRAELMRYYPEIAAAARACRFADCTHDGEPGCAVGDAVQGGHIATVRLESYHKIAATLPA